MTVVAVIGCGRISDMAHFPALSEMENVRIKYACDLLIEKAEEKKAKYPKIENVVTDYKVCLEDKEVDAVFVLTPNYAHYTITMDALKAGKHVLCEKPITVNYELSVKMAEEAESRVKSSTLAFATAIKSRWKCFANGQMRGSLAIFITCIAPSAALEISPALAGLLPRKYNRAAAY